MTFHKYIILFLTINVCFTTGCQQKQLENNLEMENGNPTNTSNVGTSIDIKIETEQINNNQEAIEKEESIIISEKKPDISPAKEQIKQPVNTYTNNEQEMISTLNEMERQTDILLQSNEPDIQNKLKGIFITTVDFIFYDGKINGVTFEELGENAKQQVLKTAASIDSKIENRFPNYKETISTKTKNAFHAIGDMIHKGANNIQEFSKEKLGEENYNSLINAKEELFYYTKNAFQTLGNVASGIWNSTEGLRDKASNTLKNGKDKVKDWYENLKNGN